MQTNRKYLNSHILTSHKSNQLFNNQYPSKQSNKISPKIILCKKQSKRIRKLLLRLSQKNLKIHLEYF